MTPVVSGGQHDMGAQRYPLTLSKAPRGEGSCELFPEEPIKTSSLWQQRGWGGEWYSGQKEQHAQDPEARDRHLICLRNGFWCSWNRKRKAGEVDGDQL